MNVCCVDPLSCVVTPQRWLILATRLEFLGTMLHLLSVSLLDAFFYYVKDYGTLCDKDLFLLPFVKMSYYSKYFELLL